MPSEALAKEGCRVRYVYLIQSVAFLDERKAEAFERYLKSGSGHAFAKKRLW